MTNNEIVQKLWKMADVLRDDGISYQNYVTELTYILFLKMMKEQGTESTIPDGYRWDDLVTKEGIELKTFYKKLLLDLGNPEIATDKRLNMIYADASTSIDEPKNLEKIIKDIDALDWYSAKHEGLGDLYEGLLEKNANETKSGAGQYFTPRVLIDVMVELMSPEKGERLNDPAAGTFGFMIAADHYLKEKYDDFFELSQEEVKFQKDEALSGMELVPNTHKFALMNALLHDINPRLEQGDSLSANGKWMKGFDLVLTNPPFGTKKGGERATRDDLTYETSNKQLNFLQTIYNSLKTDGHARAAVVVPDNVLFDSGVGESIRRDLMDKTNLHTILRLPTGIFYAQGVQTNVLFFTRGTTEKDNTKDVWIYDMRNNMRSFGKRNPLNHKDFEEFIEVYKRDDIGNREETWSNENPNGRWRKYSIDQIKSRDNLSLDISWMEAESDTPDYTIAEMLDLMQEKSDNIANAVARLQELLGEVEE
ncbi:SAM-dependent methyltransferase [Enterococcus faecalis]|uniref:site-specific DNA-methyltransferase (adenine-specific) n=1 Tax=Enterococcus faecalis TaxID=1351 RepID=A0A8B3RNX3_ENTFL|nr:N-6 DNA methylase [Enterococcus faecalis]EAE3637181.1 SAM-dependent methyltransferase [Listeria monocytogenes]EAE5953427.1 SAM-dependent methyltransferase [Listeria monocytogenes]EGO2582598.1 N-6 DNA methylase [Enterococcus faecalis]EGO2585344.1 N-6 DNA methylase [Enterococcus faecalis]EGO2590730.1 N-6 DNA methylase [Enterococcus faecalis]